MVKTSSICFGALALSLAVYLSAATPVVAQDGYDAPSGMSVGLGGVVAIKPKYEGSDEYDVYGFPIIFPQFGGGSGFADRIKIRGADDVRLRVFETGGFEVGPLAGYAFGRDEDDGDLLRGLGDVDDGIVLGAYAGYRFGVVLLDVSYHHIVSGDDTGYQIRFGGEIEQRVASNAIVTARVGATFADDNYMDTYFGISAAQSASSVAGLSAYDATSGIKDVHFELGTRIDLTDRWQLRAGARYGRLLGDAADSPIVETENQFSGMIGAAYRFDFGGY
ncbi:Outer membrane scaffolding protein for murein synthesis, MipA/OmpV family [Filomicrobium insigne]|uniref:Outer membrane scaffolding protein for murein synthesis, MipA/OmpV family n=1 Tax=Filomicrobium insigne TaxID=418854 RepID=A0A1H0QZE1_9HYPH|nr:MipA/OmpV family protein [Filomicrobium insigne]SDP22641.1 Outer membrane scaffolding protein for murein synthesis, MipA/OmpV family [Filomicrobium insigne]